MRRTIKGASCSCRDQHTRRELGDAQRRERRGGEHVDRARAEPVRHLFHGPGHFQTDLMGLAVEVKDSTRNPETWAYYAFGEDNKTSEAMPKGNPCWQCHDAHAAVEHTLVQFYPTLKPVAKKFGVYNEAREQDQDVK